MDDVTWYTPNNYHPHWHPFFLNTTFIVFSSNVHLVTCMHAKKKTCYVDVILGVTYLRSVGLWCNMLYLPCVHPKGGKAKRKRRKQERKKNSNI
jgi:hypothetical protein